MRYHCAVILSEKYREQRVYLFWGVMTTLVNYLSFGLLFLLYREKYILLCNLTAFAVATCFAFLVNKLFVFQSRCFRWQVAGREAAAFAGSRIASFLVEELGLFFCSSVLRLGQYTLFSISCLMFAKIALSFLATLLNYLFSKFLVFRS